MAITVVAVTVVTLNALMVSVLLPSVSELMMSVKLVLIAVASSAVPLTKVLETDGFAMALSPYHFHGFKHYRFS